MSLFITLGDILAIGALVLCVLVWILAAAFRTIKQRRCAHDSGVRETAACDAICRRCGKNLGFIGAWLERQMGEK